MKKEEIIECLFCNAKKDNITIDKEAAELIAIASYGSMREALSIFYRASVLSSNIYISLIRSILYFIEDQDLNIIGECMLKGEYLKLYDILYNLIFTQNIVAISIVRQLINYFKNMYINLIEQEKCVRIMIRLNKLHLETMKTSMFNEVALITLCEICYFLK